jgi:hypothetical protein
MHKLQFTPNFNKASRVHVRISHFQVACVESDYCHSVEAET